jgi:hypothetical protein
MFEPLGQNPADWDQGPTIWPKEGDATLAGPLPTEPAPPARRGARRPPNAGA